MKISNVVAGAALFASTVAAADLDPIVIKGSKFFYENKGEQLYGIHVPESNSIAVY